MHSLVGSDSVHTTAAICDYLDDRLSPGDTVTVVAVASTTDPTARRDCQDALNAASVRLTATASVDTRLCNGDPAAVLLEAAAETDPDEIVVGSHGWHSDESQPVGATVETILERANRPAVVVPTSTE
ncbi:universal stress protein [Natrarchaeobius oligotrophus]|uniref:Universal stress protein n=1 Tax=Natrarchaeobius chitinivorans TaxID=1679083 RepID=A0A3N6PNA9_NATCH|nr:universal stress protein [Natrarchaeobius chitinivorans]RQH03190.1 universal stress protein [Natrarchaeobius chitinivorans]